MDKLAYRVNFSTKVYDFIEELKGEDNIYIFGAGSLADTVLERLKIYGICCEGALVDRKYYKINSTVNGIRVYEWESFVADKDIIVVMAMSDMKRGLEIGKKEFVKKIVYPGNVGFESDKLLNQQYLNQNIKKYEEVYDKLSDKESEEILVAYLNSCISQYNPLIFPLCEKKAGYFNRISLRFMQIRTYINIGAYTGDTIDEFKEVNNTFERIYAVEVELALAQYLEKKYSEDKRITVISKAFWNKEGSLVLTQCDNANSVGCVIKNSGNGNKVDCTTMDKYFTECKGKIDLISIALRGQENVLNGAGELITRDHPMIIAKVGFERDGVLKVVNTIYNIDSSYVFFLRFKDNRAEELTVYAVQKGNL